MGPCCPVCQTPLAQGGPSRHKCGLPLESGRPTIAHRITVTFARLLILLTLVFNIIGWVRCLTDIDSAVMTSLLNGLLGLLLLVAGLIARYQWAWLIGLAHFELPCVMFALVWLFGMGPLQARPVFVWADAMFLLVMVPASLIGFYRGATSRPFEHFDLCHKCGSPLAGEAPRTAERLSATVARWLVAITFGVWLIGWLGCWLTLKSGIAFGLVSIVLSAAMIGLGLRGRYPGAWKMGMAHCLFFVLIPVLMAVNYGSPRKARVPFIGLAAVYLAITAPLTLRIWRSVPTKRHRMMCIECGYLLYGLTEARCPECGTAFDPKLLNGPNPADGK